MDKVSLDDLTDEIVCQICLQEFDDPRVLPCHHYYCARCILDTCIRKVFTCPTCRCVTMINRPLPVAFMVHRLMSKVQRLKDLHPTTPTTHCLEHNSPMKLTCLDCRIMVCPECILTTHKKHSYEYLTPTTGAGKPPSSSLPTTTTIPLEPLQPLEPQSSECELPFPLVTSINVTTPSSHLDSDIDPPQPMLSREDVLPECSIVIPVLEGHSTPWNMSLPDDIVPTPPPIPQKVTPPPAGPSPPPLPQKVRPPPAGPTPPPLPQKVTPPQAGPTPPPLPQKVRSLTPPPVPKDVSNIPAPSARGATLPLYLHNTTSHTPQSLVHNGKHQVLPVPFATPPSLPPKGLSSTPSPLEINTSNAILPTTASCITLPTGDTIPAYPPTPQPWIDIKKRPLPLLPCIDVPGAQGMQIPPQSTVEAISTFSPTVSGTAIASSAQGSTEDDGMVGTFYQPLNDLQCQ